MTFKGNVAQVPISNIVQALLLNGQEGVLTLDSGTTRRKFRILRSGIRPLLTVPEDSCLLRNAVTKAHILTGQQFDTVMSTWDPSTLFPGGFLLQRRALTADQVEHCIRKQFRESIHEILAAPDLQYEFSASDRFVDHEIFDPDGVGSTLIYNINVLLMESVHRKDEWRRI